MRSGYLVSTSVGNVRALLIGLVCVVGSGCASFYEPVPFAFPGPKAYIVDTCVPEEIAKARCFYVAEIDGKPVKTAVYETRRASFGQPYLSLKVAGRSVFALPVKLKLVGSHYSLSMAGEAASRLAGTFYSVEGVLDFVPVDGKYYEIKGELGKDESFVWIEDGRTKEVVSRKISSRENKPAQ